MRQCLDEISRYRRGMAPAPPHLAQIGVLPGAKRSGVDFRSGEQIADLGRSQHRVGDAAQRGGLLGAGLAAARRHHRRGIPMQDTDCPLDRAKPSKAGFQILIGAHPEPPPRLW